MAKRKRSSVPPASHPRTPALDAPAPAAPAHVSAVAPARAANVARDQPCPTRRRDLVWAALLAVLVVAVFLPVLKNQFVDYDDTGYVLEKTWVAHGLTWPNVVHAFRTTEIAYWHPLTWLSHLLDVELFGQNPWGHHLTSACLHAINAGLLFLVLRAMTGKIGRSWFVAALFGLHPLHVESVAWASERKDVLSTFFLLLAMSAYIRWVYSANQQKRGALLYYILSWLAFAGGLMSKPMVVTLPCLMLLLDYWPLNRIAVGPWPAQARRWVALVLEKVPFFLLTVVIGLVTVHAQKALGTVLTLGKMPFGVRLGNALAAYGAYLEKCFVPAKLAVFYPFPKVRPVGAMFAAAAILILVTCVAVLWRRRKPYIVTGWFWFLGTLVPAIGLVQVGSQAMADRYTYVPLVGIFIIITWGIAEAAANLALPSTLLRLAAAATLAVCSALTVRQIGFWRNSVTLFEHALAVTHDNWCAHFCLGYYYAVDAKQLDRAFAEYRAALEIAPDFADAHFSLGTLLARNPATLDAAIQEYQTALRLKSNYAEAEYALGKAWAQRPGHAREAIEAYRSAVQLAPDNAAAHNELGDLLSDIPDRASEAVAEYEIVLRLRPDWIEVRMNLGAALAAIPGKLPDAIAQYEILLRAKPNFAEAHNNLANALRQIPGRTNDAVAEYQTAIRLRPDYFEAEFNLGHLLATLPGRDAEAAEHFRAALRIRPDFEPARAMLDSLQAQTAVR